MSCTHILHIVEMKYWRVFSLLVVIAVSCTQTQSKSDKQGTEGSCDALKRCSKQSQVLIQTQSSLVKLLETTKLPTDLRGLRRIKQCAWKKGDGKDVGLIKECDFVKKSSATGLRVAYYGDLRVIGLSKGACRRWYFTINNKECSDPGPIDGIIYSNDQNDNHHRPSPVEGICKGIPKGQVKVKFHVEACPGYGSADGYTGWGTLRIYVEEVSLID